MPSPGVLYQNQLIETASVGFTDVTGPPALLPIGGQSALIFLDLENDGDLDIFSGFNGSSGANRLFRNDLDSQSWLSLKLVGTRSNRDGIGASISLQTGALKQYRQHTLFSSSRAGNQSRRVHFGLGAASTVDELSIHWPSGCDQTLNDIPSNQVLEVVETCGVPVTIDIKPGSFPSSINLTGKVIIAVAILSTPDFMDPSSVDVTTVRFGPAEATAVHGGHLEDLNGDGKLDLVLHFQISETGIGCSDTSASLTGHIFGG